jgi:hypothetical protein
MKDLKTRMIVPLALVGVGAIVYMLWHAYQREAVRERASALFAAPASSGVPDVLHAPPGPPPPQP